MSHKNPCPSRVRFGRLRSLSGQTEVTQPSPRTRLFRFGSAVRPPAPFRVPPGISTLRRQRRSDGTRVTGDQGEVKQAASQLQMMEFTANVKVDDNHPDWMITIQSRWHSAETAYYLTARGATQAHTTRTIRSPVKRRGTLAARQPAKGKGWHFTTLTLWRLRRTIAATCPASRVRLRPAYAALDTSIQNSTNAEWFRARPGRRSDPIRKKGDPRAALELNRIRTYLAPWGTIFLNDVS
jgi:hypothetical protein